MTRSIETAYAATHGELIINIYTQVYTMFVYNTCGGRFVVYAWGNELYSYGLRAPTPVVDEIWLLVDVQ